MNELDPGIVRQLDNKELATETYVSTMGCSACIHWENGWCRILCRNVTLTGWCALYERMGQTRDTGMSNPVKAYDWISEPWVNEALAWLFKLKLADQKPESELSLSEQAEQLMTDGGELRREEAAALVEIVAALARMVEVHLAGARNMVEKPEVKP